MLLNIDLKKQSVPVPTSCRGVFRQIKSFMINKKNLNDKDFPLETKLLHWQLTGKLDWVREAKTKTHCIFDRGHT